MALQVLLLGDLHLGRRPIRLPPEGGTSGTETWARQLSSQAAWERAVAIALERGVDAVLLAGDVIQKNDDRFQAFGTLESGVRRMADAGIRVLGVAGNHDDIALPRLARHIEGFRLLGEGGRFELVTVETRSGPFRVLGWSFPQRDWPEDPLGNLPPELRVRLQEEARPEEGPTFGLLHTQLEGRNVPYAPTRRADLAEVGVRAWFLGHVHAPSLRAGPVGPGERPIGYLGSVTGNDIGEAGARGPWLARIDGERLTSLEHLPLGPVRFEAVDLPLESLPDALGTEAEREDAVLARLRELFEELSAEAARQTVPATALAVRVRLTGAHGRHRELAQLLERLASDGISWDQNGVTCYIEKGIDDGRTVLDLADLAHGSDPVALLARRLQGLEAESSGEANPEARSRVLLRAGHQLLEELLAERNPRRAGA